MTDDDDDDDYIPFEGAPDTMQRRREWLQTPEGQEFQRRQLEKARVYIAAAKARKAARE